MGAAPAGTSEADWLAQPAAVGAVIVAQQDEIEQLRTQLIAQAIALAQLRERIGLSSGNSSKPPSSDGPAPLPPREHCASRSSSAKLGICQVTALVSNPLAVPSAGADC